MSTPVSRQLVLIYSFSMFLFVATIAADRIQAHLEAHETKASAAGSRHSKDAGSTGDWCLSQDQFVESSFVWTIGNFSLSPQNVGQSINSSIFPAGAIHRYKWQLVAYPRGMNGDSEDHLSIRLLLFEHEPKDEVVQAKFKISILSHEHDEFKTRETDTLLEFVEGRDLGYDTFIERYYIMRDKASVLPDDKLTIFCQVKVLAGSCQYTGQLGRPPVPQSRLPDDLQHLLEGQKFSDITIAVGDREFKAHKAILAARSAVFAAMFEHDMKEMQLSRVEVNDIEAYVFEELLRFIYTGKSILDQTQKCSEQPQQEEERDIQQVMAVELLRAAAKYQLDRLKIICEHRLYQDISVDSVVDIIALADQFNAESLKERAVEFVSAHAAEVIETEAWNRLLKENPNLQAEVNKNILRRALGLTRPEATDLGCSG